MNHSSAANGQSIIIIIITIATAIAIAIITNVSFAASYAKHDISGD